MEILIIFYIVFAVIIALFSVAVLIYDIATEIRQRKACTGEIADGAGTRQDSSECKEEGEEQSSTKQSLEFDAPYALRQTGTKTEVPLDTPADATFGTPNEADGEKQQYIFFSQPAAMTLEEKYAALGERERVFFDEIASYAAAVPNSRKFRSSSYEEYKLGRDRLVRLLIRRGVVTAEFIIVSPELKSYFESRNINLMQAPIRIKIADETAVAAAKAGIDIALKFIEQSKPKA